MDRPEPVQSGRLADPTGNLAYRGCTGCSGWNFRAGPVALDSQETKDHACGGFRRRAYAKKTGKNWKDPRREKGEKWRRCMVERLSARNHLVTGESKGREEPLESDGMTRLSREMEKTSRKPGMHP
ncbi:hypothetical protein CRG98_029536 [Punica granatum]|uniref:Uncharacterized protein n=1 Tax=Punica granatum TaxID=22663 RepID=A0A2I0J1F1_PUNGR|nr:hypothetical protein CRG98_029536 [Punica granatum]